MKAFAILALFVGVGGLAGCGDAEGEKALQDLQPRLAPLRAKKQKIQAALPAEGKEVEAGCKTPRSGQVYVFDETLLRRENGGEEKPKAGANERTTSALEFPTDEAYKKMDAMRAQVGFLEKRLPVAEKVESVIVVRTTATTKGALGPAGADGKYSITEARTWKGWAFLVSVEGELLGSWPVAATSANDISAIVDVKHPGQMLEQSMNQSYNAEMAKTAKAHCGVEVTAGPESPF
jgi:hypothetical protein